MRRARITFTSSPAANSAVQLSRRMRGPTSKARACRGAKLRHQLRHSLDEILLGDQPRAVRVERLENGAWPHGAKSCGRLHRLEGLRELTLINGSRPARIDLGEEGRHFLTGRHSRAGASHGLRRKAAANSRNVHAKPPVMIGHLDGRSILRGSCAEVEPMLLGSASRWNGATSRQASSSPPPPELRSKT